MLRRNGYPIEKFKHILDFGCGCGRIVRWCAAFKDTTEICGSDYNPLLIEWCQKELSSIGKFVVNQAAPPLPYPDEKFDFVYAYSVITHFSEELQKPWLCEMARVLQPGGILLITAHGKRVVYRGGGPPEVLKALDESGLYVHRPEVSGENACAAFHSEKYLLNLQDIGLEVLEYLPGGVRDLSEQDMYLYRKVKP